MSFLKKILSMKISIVILIIYIVITSIFIYAMSSVYIKKEYYKYIKKINKLEKENKRLNDELHVYLLQKE